jgi:hypothetical protein
MDGWMSCLAAADPDAGYPYDSLPMADWLDQVRRTQTYVASHLVLLVGIRRQAIQALMSHSRGNIIPPAVRTVDWQCCAVSDVDAL